ncbi:hypothetical protein ARMGADRAFT_148356 [Armillaria gallica]|uniref:Uncharacterized protein n=1 Tax=Armillaria gallica TaxID=47427 RepID=A0A2H3DXT0_ARMGA|nr:hypothetical protein ARMGADRAFT_148356 [Armillaria gallica]
MLLCGKSVSEATVFMRKGRLFVWLYQTVYPCLPSIYYPAHNYDRVFLALAAIAKTDLQSLDIKQCTFGLSLRLPHLIESKGNDTFDN